MNRVRRAALAAIQDKLSEMQEELQALMEEEEEYRDNIPENLQGSEKYSRTEEICDQLGDAVENVESAISSIEEACD